MFSVIFFAALLLPNLILCGPLPDATSESLLIVGGDSTTTAKPKEPRLPELKSMHVTSNIRNRYARTTIETKYLNPEDQSQEATFTITLPDTAFISGFVMEIGEKKYEAYVREKEEAKKEYQQAVERGQSAGHVAMSARDSKTFTVSVNVEPLSKILFTLTYEQLLKRKHGKYEMVINLSPGQLVEDFNVDVNINETRKIINVDTPGLRSGNEITEATKVSKNQFATISNLNEDQTEVNIHFSPSVEQQKEMMVGTKGSDGSKGLSGQFVVEYDVERDPQGGEVIISDGYFVHFFAPSELEPIPKHIVFVLDVSGSMAGQKMKQLREAMKVILGELNSEDYFHLIKFSSGVQIWNEVWKNIEDPSESELPSPYSATEDNIRNVQKVVERMSDEGMTNIYDALAVALRLTAKGANNNDNEIQEIQPIIVFLTDGQANQGISNYDEILKMVDTRNEAHRAAIFALSFGDFANKDFLKNLGSKNLGFMRTIYEAADASLQLEDFYREISSPLLTKVKFIYDDQVSNLTKYKFDILFKGGELVVAGKVTDAPDKFVSVEARTLNGTHRFIPRCILPRPWPKPVQNLQIKEKKKEYGSLERLWAYMTIKQLLNKKYETKNEDENKVNEKEALKIALKYSFVTPLTSLVVVKPNSTESSETKPATRKLYTPGGSFSFPGRFKSTRLMSAHLGNSQSSDISARSSFTPYMRFGGGRLNSHRISRIQHSYTTTQPPSTHFHSLQADLPWLSSLLSGPDEFTLNNQKYLIGNNGTTVEDKACQVNTLNLAGKCTLLTACPKIYPALTTLQTYEKYFCSLDSGRYAGVCCVEN